MAPVPAPKVERVPEKPEQKIRYVPEEVHKQIKDPFEKQDLSPEEYEQWLKELEQEQVNESIPARPSDEDVEEWLRDLERETSKTKVKPWIYGIFK
jgi:predicted acetyltransferase